MTHRLADLAAMVGADLEGDPDRPIDGIATLMAAGPRDLSFLANPRYRDQAVASKAGALLVSRDLSRETLADLRADLVLCDDAVNLRSINARLSHQLRQKRRALQMSKRTIRVVASTAVVACAALLPSGPLSAQTEVEIIHADEDAVLGRFRDDDGVLVERFAVARTALGGSPFTEDSFFDQHGNVESRVTRIRTAEAPRSAWPMAGLRPMAASDSLWLGAAT